jgi:hypothetical protein
VESEGNEPRCKALLTRLGRHSPRSTYPTFSSLTSRVHPNDESAIDYINDHLNERAFAVINLGADTFDPTDIDFTIRMNYTTLPNTNWVSRYISLGLNRRYQRYYLSGFMTIQRTLADFAFELSGCEGAEVRRRQDAERQAKQRHTWRPKPQPELLLP